MRRGDDTRRDAGASASGTRAAARLALSKWHSTRAANQNMRTVSMDFIVPLRHRMSRLRQEIGRQVV